MTTSEANSSSQKLFVTAESRPSKLGRGRGRGKKKLDAGIFNGISPVTLKKKSDIIGMANSESTKKNIRRARTLLNMFAKKCNAPDPKKVNGNSSDLVLNLLMRYCNYGTPEALKDDTLGCLIQGLRLVYLTEGHEQSWVKDDVTKEGKGNPLIGNPAIVEFRRAHRVNLAKNGIVTLRARPVTASQICEHAVKFWFPSNQGDAGQKMDLRDVELHAILVLGVNQGLRFDEISKLRIEHVTLDCGSIRLTLTVAIKNSTEPREYEIRKWPGNTALRNSVLMDPFVAILSWLLIRGNSPGWVFCDVVNTRGGSVLNPNNILTARKFTGFFRDRLRECGVASGDVEKYSGHSLKRGAVQLYRSLGLRDEQVMEIVQMKGPRAYANYCEAYNDCAPNSLPRFNSAAEFIKHAKTIENENSQMRTEKGLNQAIEELIQEYDEELLAMNPKD